MNSQRPLLSCSLESACETIESGNSLLLQCQAQSCMIGEAELCLGSFLVVSRRCFQFRLGLNHLQQLTHG